MEDSNVVEAQRTCVGCRRPAARGELLRLVAMGEPAQWVPDIRRRLPGRGTSVHPSRRCLGLAVKQGRLRGAATATSASDLAAVASGQYRRRAAGLLGGALRSRQLAVGAEAVRDSLAERTIRLLVIATDAAGNRHDFEAGAERLGRRCLVWATKTELGAMLGRETVGVLGVLDEAIGDELRSAVQHIGALAEDA
jgi:predicted RNA-binding protein YlxR (DUF448 family)